MTHYPHVNELMVKRDQFERSTKHEYSRRSSSLKELNEFISQLHHLASNPGMDTPSCDAQKPHHDSLQVHTILGRQSRPKGAFASVPYAIPGVLCPGPRPWSRVRPPPQSHRLEFPLLKLSAVLRDGGTVVITPIEYCIGTTPVQATCLVGLATW
jgi:hypothetical protein